MKNKIRSAAVLTLAIATTAACGGSGDSGASGGSAALTAHGPVKIWLSNNKEELAWGKDDGEGLERRPPQGAGDRAGDPRGQDVRRGHRRGDHGRQRAVPGLQHRPRSRSRVPEAGRPRGARQLQGRQGLRRGAHRRRGRPVQVAGREVLPDPVEVQPRHDLLQQGHDEEGRDRPQRPAAGDLRPVPGNQQEDRVQRRGQGRHLAVPGSEFFQSWFDFYPLYAAESDGKQLVEDGKATFDSDAGKKVANFWRTMYADKLAPQEAYTGDSFADKKAAMSVVGPWAIPVYKDKVNWGVAPVPTSTGMTADKIHTFSDAKNVAIYSACKNQGTAWDLLKFSTSQEQDGALLTTTGQMPLRKDVSTVYGDYLTAHPAYKMFADQAARTVEVPNVNNSIAIWQAFRDSYSKSVIFGTTPVDASLTSAANKVTTLAGQS